MTQAQDEEGRELQESRLYTLVDARADFALYFLEGQKLIRDLALLHRIHGAGFAYFRDAVLSVQLMLAFLKRGEQFGFYIDSEEPHFRLKIETSHHGETRCALVPEFFREFPEAMRGVARLLKLFPNNRAPYQSVLPIEGESLGGIVNRVLAISYQVPSVVVLSPWSDQSVMLHRLPRLRGEAAEDPSEEVRDLAARLAVDLDRIFGMAIDRPEDLAGAFSGIGFRILAARDVRFRCSCSRERMVRNLRLVCDGGVREDELFDPDRNELEIICEYCKSVYRIARFDLAGSGDEVH